MTGLTTSFLQVNAENLQSVLHGYISYDEVTYMPLALFVDILKTSPAEFIEKVNSRTIARQSVPSKLQDKEFSTCFPSPKLVAALKRSEPIMYRY